MFLPYSPLHHQLLQRYGKPIVATSGNISGEPVITDNQEAQQRLSGVADAFLHHNRPIVRPADDPVIRPMAGAARAIRLGRGHCATGARPAEQIAACSARHRRAYEGHRGAGLGRSRGGFSAYR